MAASLADDPLHEPPLHLLDLDADLLVHTLSFASARGQATARAVCKLFALCVAQVEQSSPYLASSIGEGAQALDDISPRLTVAPSVGLLFCAAAQSVTGLDALAARLPSTLHLVGAQTQQLVGTPGGGAPVSHKRHGDPGVLRSPAQPLDTLSLAAALSLGHFPEAEVASFAIDKNSNWEEQLQAQGALRGDWKVILVVSRHNSTDDIVSALQAAQPGAAIIGGTTTKHTHPSTDSLSLALYDLDPLYRSRSRLRYEIQYGGDDDDYISITRDASQYTT